MPGIVFTRRNAAGAVIQTIAGGAILVRGDPERYKALGLVMSAAPCLLFTPDQPYGRRSFTTEFVKPGDTTQVNGLLATVKDVDPIGPDGKVIVARIIVGL